MLLLSKHFSVDDLNVNYEWLVLIIILWVLSIWIWCELYKRGMFQLGKQIKMIKRRVKSASYHDCDGINSEESEKYLAPHHSSFTGRGTFISGSESMNVKWRSVTFTNCIVVMFSYSPLRLSYIIWIKTLLIGKYRIGRGQRNPKRAMPSKLLLMIWNC